MLVMWWLVGLIALARSQDWTAVRRDVKIDIDLQKNPLQIRTNSAAGSRDKINLYFYQGYKLAGGLNIYFTDPMKYWMSFCKTGFFTFSTTPTAERDKVWTILRTDIGLKVECNGVLVLHFDIAQCTDSSKDLWENEVKQIEFYNSDTASDQYIAPEPKDNTLSNWQIGLIAAALIVVIGVVILLSIRKKRCPVVQFNNAAVVEDPPVLQLRTPEPAHPPHAARTIVRESNISIYNDCVGEPDDQAVPGGPPVYFVQDQTLTDVAPPSYQDVQEHADLYYTPAAAGL